MARRLHLGYHYEDELRYQEKVRDELKVQNEKYGRVRELQLEQQRNSIQQERDRQEDDKLTEKRGLGDPPDDR